MTKRNRLILTLITWTLILVPIAILMLCITEVLFNWPLPLPEGYRDMLDWYLPF